MKLKDIAHSRTGDKGNISIISVIVNDPKDYSLICEKVTADKVRETLQPMAKGRVDRYEVDSIHALNFVLQDALGGGVTRSLALDRHGKCLGSILLDMDIS